MRLIHRRTLKPGDDQYVYPPKEAVIQIKTALARYQKVEGMAELRRGLMINHDHYAWREIERGEWLLIKPEARSFDWKHFAQQAHEQKAMALLENPPPQKVPPTLNFRLFDSETAELLVKRKYHAMFGALPTELRLDLQGFGTLPIASKKAKITVRLGNGY